MSKLEDLKVRISVARAKEPDDAPKKAADPMRVGLELISGVLVGTALGFYLDKWLETTPLFLIILMLLGSAAGFRNVMRLTETPESQDSEEQDRNV